ncbi:unnamed protein product [Lupinus luteus]|uniref:Uncharacterized protein n=1 Tax=Lupinus luteus TaxID=3873 RepID=A0AAV1X5F2_LUPLU
MIYENMIMICLIWWITEGRNLWAEKKPPPPKKLKRASSSQPPLELDRSKFRKRGKQERNTLLLNWVFVLERKIRLNQDHILQQNEILRQGQVYHHQGMFAALQILIPGNQIWGSTDIFTEQFPWPGVRPMFPGGPGPSGTTGNPEDGDGGDEAAHGDDDDMDFMN